MGDFTFLVPPSAATATPPAAAAVVAPEPGGLAVSAAAGPAAPRCRRVHFVPDIPSSSSAPVWSFPPSAATAEASASAVAELEEDRMDLLWEDFNEELLAMRLGRAAGSPPSSWSDVDDSSESSAGRAPAAAAAGCFPVLRSSARAGGVAHYRRRAGSWVLLMKIFRRLFVIDKSIAALPGPAGAAPPAARGGAVVHW